MKDLRTGALLIRLTKKIVLMCFDVCDSSSSSNLDIDWYSLCGSFFSKRDWVDKNGLMAWLWTSFCALLSLLSRLRDLAATCLIGDGVLDFILLNDFVIFEASLSIIRGFFGETSVLIGCNVWNDFVFKTAGTSVTCSSDRLRSIWRCFASFTLSVRMSYRLRSGRSSSFD